LARRARRETGARLDAVRGEEARMSSEVPRHAGPDPEDAGRGYGQPAGPGWPVPDGRDDFGQPGPPGEATHVQPPAGGPVRASASVPVARATAHVEPHAMPPDLAASYEQVPAVSMGTAPIRLHPAQHPGGTRDDRATGTAHVPQNALLPAHQLPALPMPVPRVYGRPTVSGYPPPGTISAPSGGSAPAAPPVSPLPGPVTPGPASGGPPPVAAGSAAVARSSQLQYGGPPQAQTYGTPRSAATVQPPPGPPPAPSRPPGDGAAREYDRFGPPAEGSGSHTGLLIAVGAVVLIAVVGMVAFMWPRAPQGPQFPVNSCVRQASGVAVATDCSAAGAFVVVSQVESKDQCPDPNQPFVELGTGTARILCLAPATGAGPGDASPTPGPSTT
jgi:hypothetical protein